MKYFQPSMSTFAFCKCHWFEKTRQSKHCGFSIYIFDNSKSIMKKVKINGQVGQGEEDGLVWSGLCQKDSQDDFDSEYVGFDGSPDD